MYTQDLPWYEQIHEYYFITGLYIIFAFIIFIWIFKRTKNTYHSHWNTLIPNFTYSSKAFYDILEKELLSHNIQGIDISRENLSEGSVISARRIYLRVLWKEYQYDMCCAPFGDGLFLSWWLMYKISIGEKILSRIPFIGRWFVRVFFPVTYYRIDTASMFMTYAQNAVTKVIDDITKDTGYRLSTDDRKPQVKDVFKR